MNIPTHKGGARFWVALDEPDGRPLSDWVLDDGRVIVLDDGTDPAGMTDAELAAVLP
jgi:hypothetical protein